MKSKLMLLFAAALFIGSAALGLSLLSTSVDAASGCGPQPYGWRCTCSTSIVPNVVCMKPGGGSGHVSITTCISCPPPCPPGEICEIQFCRTSTTTSCI